MVFSVSVSRYVPRWQAVMERERPLDRERLQSTVPRCTGYYGNVCLREDIVNMRGLRKMRRIVLLRDESAALDKKETQCLETTIWQTKGNKVNLGEEATLRCALY